MASADIKINGVAASNTDLPIDTLVQLDNQNTGGELTFLWAIIDQPPGAADALSATNIQNPTFTPKKEGTYLIELVVNQTLPSEVRDRKIVGIRQLKTRQRVPAADERTEGGSRGWADAGGEFLQLVDARTADPSIIVGATGAIGLAVGNIVRCTGKTIIKLGLPGQENVPTFTSAPATSLSNVDELLGIIVGAVDGSGGPYASGVLVRVRIAGLFEGVAGAPVVGDPVYVSDTAVLALAPGANTRQVGSVAAVGGGAFDTWFDGTGGSAATLSATPPVNVNRAAAATGVAGTAARADHKHSVDTASAVALDTLSVSSEGVGAQIARADHTHKISVADLSVSAVGGSNVISGFPVFGQLDAATPLTHVLAAGRYLLLFSARYSNNTNNSVSYVQLQAGVGAFGASAQISSTQRWQRAIAVNVEHSIDISVVFTVPGPAVQTLYVAAAATVGGVLSFSDRSLIAVRLA